MNCRFPEESLLSHSGENISRAFWNLPAADLQKTTVSYDPSFQFAQLNISSNGICFAPRLNNQ
jgi:hypothetical protein